MRVLGNIVYGLICVIFTAFVITRLWGWFIVPFFELPELTVLYALGISMTARLILPSFSDKKSEEYEMEDYLKWVLTPAMGLLLGWIVHLLIIY